MKMRPSLVLRRLIQLGLTATVLALLPGVAPEARGATSTNAAPAIASKPAVVPAVLATKDDTSDADDKAKGHSFNVKIDTDDDKHDSSASGAVETFMDDLIPLAGITATFGTPVLIVFFVAYFKFRGRREALALAREYLGKGLPVPPELLDPSQKTFDMGWKYSGSRSQSDLRRGLRLAFIGLGLTLAFHVSFPHSTMWGWGLIPTIMGVGLILSGWFENRRGQSRPPGPAESPPSPPGNRLL
jgi:hypothetical protein